MIGKGGKNIMLRDIDGDVRPFDISELQTRLIGGFLAAGLREESFLSEEIVLALEYTLSRADRPEAVFGCAEIDAAVIRLLEQLGYPEVARIFRRMGSENIAMLSTGEAEIAALTGAHLGSSPERCAHIARLVSADLARLGISEATPHLILELSRHRERELAASDRLPESGLPVFAHPEITLTREAILRLLPPEAAELARSGVLRINGVTSLFPSVRMVFLMNGFAAMHRLVPPVTELELEPRLYAAGGALEAARRVLVAELASPEGVPCCLSIPDMFDFLERFAGGSRDDRLAAEFAGVLSSAIGRELYKLTFD